MQEFADEGRAGDNTMVGSDLAKWAGRWDTDDGFAVYVAAVLRDREEGAPRDPGWVPCTTLWWIDGSAYVGRIAIAVRYSVHDDDVTENQVLREALTVLRRTRLTDPDVSAGIARLWRQFRHFTMLKAPVTALVRLQWNRQNEHYRPLLALARLVLQNAMADLGDDDVATRGFTLTVHKVFEQFVRTAPRERWQSPRPNSRTTPASTGSDWIRPTE